VRATLAPAAGLAALILCAVAASTAVSRDASASSGHRCLVVSGVGDTAFTRNFNPYASPVDFTWGGIYEPLVVVTRAGGGREYKWLASDLSWSKDARTLIVTVRRGVRWSDGQPLTSRDVLFTLTAGRRDKAMDQIGLTRPGSEIVSIELVGDDKVAIRLERRDSTFVARVLANNLRIVPEHVFAKIHNVRAWTNPHPVGTGPFTRVERFSNQAYVLGRNPNYWLKGRPHIPCVERVLASSRDSALMQMRSGSVDLTNNFIPNVERTYVAHDPVHFHFFYATTALPIGLFFDDSRYPYSLVALRAAISMAIDRAALSREAEYGYAPPVDAIGIERNWPGWIHPETAGQAKRLSTYDPESSRRTLLAAGFSYVGTALRDPRGHPVALDAKVIGTWTDWVIAWQIIERNLEQIGIDVRVKVVPTWPHWRPDAFATRTATLLWNNFGNGPTPYDYFAQHLDRSSFVPSGHQADTTGNWEHFWSPEGTKLLRAFRSTFDVAEQRQLVSALARLWLRTLPYVPLFVGPTWSTYSTRYFTGFPTARNYYIQPDFRTSDYVVALTRIKPRR
jgi:peptide/nickel transport system substrate-binding protein